MDQIKQARKIKDYFLFGEWYHVYWIHSSFVHGMTLAIKKEVGKGLSQLIFEQDEHILRCYMSRSEWDNLGQSYLTTILKDPKRLETLLNRIRKAADGLITFNHQARSLRVDSLKKEKIITLLQEYHKFHHSTWSLGQVTNVLEMENFFLTDYLRSYLKKKGLDAKRLLEVFQVLTLPRELSMAQKEEIDLLALAKYNDKKGLVAHYEKYKWLAFGWIGPDLDYDFFAGHFQGLVGNEVAIKKLEKSFAKQDKLIETKNKYIKQLDIAPEYQKLFRLLEEVLFIKAHRMDALYMSYSAVWPILRKVAKDNHLSMKQLYALSLPELIKSLREDKFNLTKINRSLKYSIQYYDGQVNKLLIGEQARNIVAVAKQCLVVEKFKDFFQGECAWPGKVKARVKVINQASEMGKLEKGEVLVSNITDPSLLSAMKKASAFITNSGGLTCHAAITARELKTPCVVGTKIATKALKDGDMVEIDASLGTVKIIK